MAAALYVVPTPLGGEPGQVLAPAVLERVRSLSDYVAEDAKSARAFFSAVGMPCAIRDIRIAVLNEHTAPSDIPPLLDPLRAGRDLGLLSEAGCPAVADPGAALVEAAHDAGYRVTPLVGPSSIILALMASGLEGQRFAFCGYLPRAEPTRAQRIRALEARSRAERESQIFIETPYRSDVLLAALLSHCNARTRICAASDLTLPTESVVTRTVAEWKRRPYAIGRRPTVFVLQAA